MIFVHGGDEDIGPAEGHKQGTQSEIETDDMISALISELACARRPDAHGIPDSAMTLVIVLFPSNQDCWSLGCLSSLHAKNCPG